LAEYLPKYIPGHPNIIIQNAAGAASLIRRIELLFSAEFHGI